MAKTIIVGGYGSGISGAVAEKFGAEGFSVALVARGAERLSAGVKALEAKGVKAAAFPTDLGDPKAVRALVGSVRAALGPPTVLHWNAYAGDAGDLLTADVAALHRVFDVAVSGLLVAVQEALPDLKSQKESAILVTNGGFGRFDLKVDGYAAQSNNMGLALANSAKHKLVGLLSEKLKSDGIYVGELMVLNPVKGTAWDSGNATLEASAIANKFWELFRTRTEVWAQIG
jgi:NAD(P)-dependent dehydrogenase (short-subunit alcohol dehydrogenase family)